MAWRSSYPTGLKEVGPGIFAMVTPDGGANAGFVVGDDQVLVVDARMTPSLARSFRDEVRRVTDKPVRLLVNSHYHGDHTFGNQLFSPPALIISHINTRRRLAQLGNEYPAQFARNRPELAEEFQQVTMTLPSITYTDRMTVHLDGRLIELIHPGRPAHTDGDTMVYLPQGKCLFAADLLFSGIVPALMDGHCTGWIDSLTQIEGMAVETVVPGHGAVSTLKEITEMKEFLRALRQAVHEQYQNGAREEQAIKAIKMAKYAPWPFQERIEVAIRRIYQEFQAG